jgi:hypothetical protein
MIKPLEQLLQRKMNRKEFLATLGLGAVSLMGFSHLINNLSNSRGKQSDASAGYGSSAYGGKKNA